MLKHESTGKDPINNFENWYKSAKKPILIANPGIGDAIISARIAVFFKFSVFHNTDAEYREKFGKSFCNLLNISYYSDIHRNKEIYNYIKGNETCLHREQMLLPHFIVRMGRNLDETMARIFDQDHGFKRTDSTNEKIVLICPCASNIDFTKKRYMTKEQLQKIIELINPNKYKIKLVGIEKDIKRMGKFYGCDWVNTDIIRTYEGITFPFNISDFINLVAKSQFIITMDTFITHLSSIFKIPTIVLYKYDQNNNPMISPDPNDRFFLNPIWYKHFKRATYEELYSFLAKETF